MPLTIITTSVDYDDFLRLTLPHAVRWGRVVVVTKHEDHRTADIAEQHGVELFQTDAWYRNGDQFNKGRALNEAIARVKPDGWLLLLDSDIVLLPRPHSSTIDTLDTNKLYGCRRRMCETPEQWNRALRERSWYNFRIDALPPVLRKGKKTKHRRGRVWGSRPTANPVGLQGYFQLWHYPTNPRKLHEHRTAGKYDVELGLTWPDGGRCLVPWSGYTVLHLGQRKKNWAGRVTENWHHTDPIPYNELIRASELYHDS